MYVIIIPFVSLSLLLQEKVTKILKAQGVMSFGWRSGFLFHGILQSYDKTPEYDLVNVSIEPLERSQGFFGAQCLVLNW